MLVLVSVPTFPLPPAVLSSLCVTHMYTYRTYPEGAGQHPGEPVARTTATNLGWPAGAQEMVRQLAGSQGGTGQSEA